MEETNKINVKHFLWSICANKHTYKDTDKTLRFKSDWTCIICRTDRRKERKEKRLWNTGAHYIWNLCEKNHKHNWLDKTLRLVSTNDCTECKKIADKKSYDNRRDKILLQKKEYHGKNKDYLNKYCREYYKNNIEKSKEHRKIYYEKNKKLLNSKNWGRIKEKMKIDPILKLNINMYWAITKALKRKKLTKCNKPYLDLVDFTLQELMNHVEKQFIDWMSWENYWKWHLDHIIPKSRFNYNSPFDKEFIECWSLKNFQPLWATDNLQKNNKTMEEYLVYKTKNKTN